MSDLESFRSELALLQDCMKIAKDNMHGSHNQYLGYKKVVDDLIEEERAIVAKYQMKLKQTTNPEIAMTAKLIVIFDPSGRIQTIPNCPSDIKQASLDIGTDLVNEDLSAVAEHLAKLLLNQLDEVNQL